MKCSGSHCLLPVVGEDHLRARGRYAKVGAKTEGAVGAGLSAPEERERNIEGVGQAGVLTVSATAVVGYLEGRRTSAGMSWRAVVAPFVLAFSTPDSSSSPSQSSLLGCFSNATSAEEMTITPYSHTTLNGNPSQRRSRQLNLDSACVVHATLAHSLLASVFKTRTSAAPFVGSSQQVQAIEIIHDYDNSRPMDSGVLPTSTVSMESPYQQVMKDPTVFLPTFRVVRLQVSRNCHVNAGTAAALAF